MRNRKRVLVLSLTDHATDPRVHRQIEFLRDDFDVICAGAGPPTLDGVSYVRVQRQRWPNRSRPLAWARLLFRRESYYWRHPTVVDGLRQLEGIHPDLVIANDLETLPMALRAAGDAPVIFDAHEFYPRQADNHISFRLLFKPHYTELCRKYIPRAAAVLTVSPSIAGLYEELCGVKPVVITNAAAYQDLRPQSVPHDSTTIQLVHHGGAFQSRKIEMMIEMMEFLDDRFRLDLFLVEGTPGYLDRLKSTVGSHPRVHFRNPVPVTKIAQALNSSDVGTYILPPSNLNNRCALPNKLFEFVQARLAVAIGPSPEMARLVREHDLGVVADEFTPEALAEKLNALGASDVMRFKSNSHRVAHRLSADANRRTFVALVESVLGKSSDSRGVLEFRSDSREHQTRGVTSRAG